MPRFATQLDCPTVEVTPGEPLHCRLRLYNPEDAVDEYRVTGLDEAAAWVSSDPESLALMPETEGELQVVLTIPADAPVPAGRHHIVVAIHPSLEYMTTQTEDLVVDVAEVTDFELGVSTSPPASADDVTATLAVGNRGNHPLELRFNATDHDHDLPVRVEPWELVLEPFRVHGLRLTVPLGRCPVRGGHTHRVEVTAAAADNSVTRSARVIATHEPRPRRSRTPAEWLRDTARLFVVVPVAAIVLVALEVLTAWALLAGFGWPAVAVAAATSLVGAALVAYHRGAFDKVRIARANGTGVDDHVADAAVWQLAGILLLVPGFVTDLAGAVLTLAGPRQSARTRLQGALAPGGGQPPGGQRR